MVRYATALLLLCALLWLHLRLDGALPLAQQWALVTGAEPAGFDQVRFFHSALPRALLAIMVGAVLGMVGSLLQQVTQNPLVAPMTVGASSGAWLALVCASVWLPQLGVDHRALVAITGALLAVALVLAIAGRNGMGGLGIVLAGMATHILLGAAAGAIILLNQEAAEGVYLWGAGDLTQSDWRWVQWLWPHLLLLPVIFLLAPRPLSLLRLGMAGARGRGLSTGPVLVVLLLAGLWVLACSITAVGVISFIGLIAPNVARSLGTRRSGDELLFSALMGAVLLMGADALALAASVWSDNLVPSGTAAALMGAPALIVFARRQLAGQGGALAMPPGARHLHPAIPWLTGLVVLALLAGSLTHVAGSDQGGGVFSWPSELIFSLRWPRLLTAAGAGAGMAVAGLILQRLIRNPLASPDILGMSAGATLALVLFSLWTGTSIYQAGPHVAFAGSLLVLTVLLLLGRRSEYAPAMVILVGISLAAMIEALVHFVLAQGGEGAHNIVNWLSGSTYRASGTRSLVLGGGIVGLFALALLCSRWMTLISIGDSMALSRGVNVPRVRLALLLLVCALCALVTTVMGPVAFVGLLAPHLAMLLGARRVRPQLWLAMGLGMALMLLSDWLGRVLLYPQQLPAGLVAALLGGSYFLFLLSRRRPL
ncbi:MAG: Fe(3+)-hydroxamate ABC transporter permease FhuB [Oleiphilaceae bacterium]|nr:Fe(3+)-hydroxamate ABC transporter permease FhuB [Oleiphilaceae bacterium]